MHSQAAQFFHKRLGTTVRRLEVSDLEIAVRERLRQHPPLSGEDEEEEGDEERSSGRSTPLRPSHQRPRRCLSRARPGETSISRADPEFAPAIDHPASLRPGPVGVSRVQN
jgi:hypothetical protein